MAGYTLVNLKEVEDMAPKFGFAPNMEARYARVPLELEQSGVSYFRLAPDFRMPFGHRHKEQEEIYVVLSGGGQALLDDELRDLRPLDALRKAARTTRAFEAGPDGLELLAFGPHHEGDTEMIREGFWSD